MREPQSGGVFTHSALTELIHRLGACDIPVEEPKGTFPAGALMHDRAAIIPAVIISPRCEKEVVESIKLLSQFDIYRKYPVSVRSGGHGYSNEASCAGIMINLRWMVKQSIVDDILTVEPGCILGQLIPKLTASGKAVPHGDCFGVAAGGHFLTAGWDIALARRYGLGCQSVIGGSVVLWDGSKLDVNADNCQNLLYSMRGGAVAKVGVVTEIRLQLINQPPLVSRCFRHLSEAELKVCVLHRTFARAADLPRDISVSFRFHFEQDLVCSFNIISLMPAQETRKFLNKHLGTEVASFIAKPSDWREGSLMDLRMVPATDKLATDPMTLEGVTPEALHCEPLEYWKPSVSAREMASSYLTSISHWVLPECEEILLNLYKAFRTVQNHPSRERMYALIVQGGGRMTELQHRCAMPLGQVLARYELHWDDPKDEKWSKAFTQRIYAEMEPKIDSTPGRPYRGDIWLEDQGWDVNLELIWRAYNRRGAISGDIDSDTYESVGRRRRLRRKLFTMIGNVISRLPIGNIGGRDTGISTVAASNM